MSNTLFSAGIYCEQCKGSCLSASNFDTQKKAKEKFGIIPNNCVSACDGTSHCPYAPQQK